MTGDDPGRMLVAGVGNIFKSDDGFGTAVVARLAERARREWPEWVRLHDYGIGGVHLAYDLLDGYDQVVLVDAMRRPGGEPGTVYVIEVQCPPVDAGTVSAMDPHDLAPESVLALVPALGGSVPPVTVVGCEPESTEDGMGLSELVVAQVEVAARIVDGLVTEAAARRPDTFRSAVPAARLD